MIDLPDGDFSFDLLTDGLGPLDPEPVDDAAVDVENREHEALFAHVGVTDLTDWRTVALLLARRYAPTVLSGSETAPPRRKAGRPEKWDPMALAVVLTAVEELQADARAGRIKRNLSTIEAACIYFLGDPGAAGLRERCATYMPISMTVDTMKNMVSRARKMRAQCPAPIMEMDDELP